ncbi:MAG: hypothetical protein KTR26_16470 [Flammeovirgaceae bacterium]|nr:hypothetical protein [Flammeovirgaceae bacterium]
MTTKVNYSNQLLNIETGQQIEKSQLTIFDRQGKINKRVINIVNTSIDELLKNIEQGGESYHIYFPQEIEKELPEPLMKQISKEITANEVRVLTAIVILAQFAKSKGELYYWDKINRAYFEVDLPSVYKVMGIGETRGKQRELVKKAFFSLNDKKFLIVEDDNLTISKLVEIHKIDKKNPNLFKITVEGLFFNFDKSKNYQNRYFHIPSDINKQIRKVTIGRPNAGVELFIKCLYQAKHCSKDGKVEYSYSKVYKLMKLENLVKNRNTGRIKDTIQKAFDIAKKLDLISNVEMGETNLREKKYILTFTP